jgi:plastocyanin
MNKKVLTAVVVVVILAVAAVGFAMMNKKDDKASGTTPNTSNTNSEDMANMDSNNSSNNGNTQATATDKVSIANFAFSPAAITVKVGTKVTWTNNDSTAHTVTADTAGGPDSSTLDPGASYSFTFTKAGSFGYHCSLHPSMTGSVNVTE